MDFTDWYNTAEACVLVPRPRSYPKVMALVLPLTWKTWYYRLELWYRKASTYLTSQLIALKGQQLA